MTPVVSPASVPELIEVIRSVPRVYPIGARTKSRLAEVSSEFALVSALGLRGIVEYEPDEFVVTALAGTPVAELEAQLAERGQYLPFEPLFAASGATVGGAVAAGLNGPGRFRYGGLRDFILGVRFVDGTGHLLRMGGKVVKNAAGFDLPKFFVGSLGRFGFLTEVTFKVFPRPLARLTLQLRVPELPAIPKLLAGVANSRWQAEALDVVSGGDVCVRLAGPPAALSRLAEEILSRWPGVILEESAAVKLWSDVRECRWAHPNGFLLKVATTLAALPGLMTLARSFPGGLLHASAGGDFVMISFPADTDLARLALELTARKESALTVRGAAPLWLGQRPHAAVEAAGKLALDPSGRFPGMEVSG